MGHGVQEGDRFPWVVMRLGWEICGRDEREEGCRWDMWANEHWETDGFGWEAQKRVQD